jgi:hypothetical protein
MSTPNTRLRCEVCRAKLPENATPGRCATCRPQGVLFPKRTAERLSRPSTGTKGGDR